MLSYIDEIPPDVISPEPVNDINQPLKHLDTVIALYDFPGTQTNCIPLTLGDTIYVLAKNDNGWWDGVILNSSGDFSRGWFPSNYVRSVNYVQPVLNKLKSNKELDSITAANTAANVLIPSFTNYLQKNLVDDKNGPTSRKNSVVSFASSEEETEKEKIDKIEDKELFHSFSSTTTSIMDALETSIDDTFENIMNKEKPDSKIQCTSVTAAEKMITNYRKVHNKTPTWTIKPTINGDLVYYCSQLDIYCQEIPLFDIALDDINTINFEIPSYHVINDHDLVYEDNNNNNTDENLIGKMEGLNLDDNDKLFKRDSNVSINSTSSSLSVHYHHFNHPLYAMRDLFYYNSSDLVHWTELKQEIYHLLNLCLKSVKDQSKQLFHKNFDKLNKLISMLTSSIRLSQHDFADTKYETSIKRKFKRIYYSHTQIYINALLHLSYLYHSPNFLDVLFNYDASKLNMSASAGANANSISTNSSSISTLKQLPIMSIREDEKIELNHVEVIELEIELIKTNLNSLIKIFLKLTKDKRFDIKDYNGSDNSESEVDTEPLDNNDVSSIHSESDDNKENLKTVDKSRYNILPQNYPRLLSNEFNGGNWCNPFFYSSNPMLNVSGNELKNKYHQKVLIDNNAYNTINNLIGEIKALTVEALDYLAPEKQSLYYSKVLKEERNILVLRLIYKYLFYSSSLIDVLESFDFTVFCLIKQYDSGDEDINNQVKRNKADKKFQSKLNFDYPVVLEFFHHKQNFHYLIANIILSTQSLTLEDPDVFKAMKDDDAPYFYNRDIMKQPSQKATILLKSLIIQQIHRNKGDSISLNPSTQMSSYLKQAERFMEDITEVVKELVSERETIINYATRVMHDGFNVQLLVIERNNTSGTEKEDNNTTFMTGKTTNKDTPWYLEGDNEFDLLLDMKGNVKGGTKEALICHLTHHDLFDSNFNTAFLLSFSSMMSINELINLLILRFNIEAPEGLSYEEYNLWIGKKQNPIRLRVLNIMKLLLEKYWCNSYYSETLIAKWLGFLQHNNSVMNFSITQVLISHLNKLAQGEVVRVERKPVIPDSKPPAPLLRQSLVKKLKLLDIDYVELARQLTIREFKLYCKISKFHCLAKVWGKKSGLNENFDSITEFIKSSNQLTNFVSYMVLRKYDLKKRVQVIRYFVQVAEKCRQYNNFSSMTAIISALYSSPIHRLKKTWKYVSNDCVQLLQNMNKLMNSSRNFNEYRDVLKFIGSEPCIPFFGVYLSDLTFIFHGNPDTLLNRARMLNFAKRSKTSDILIALDRFKNTGYNLLYVLEIQKFLDSWFVKSPPIEEQYQLSLETEPRENESTKRSFPFSKAN